MVLIFIYFNILHKNLKDFIRSIQIQMKARHLLSLLRVILLH